MLGGFGLVVKYESALINLHRWQAGLSKYSSVLAFRLYSGFKD